MDLIEACRKIIEVDSTPDNGTVDVANFAAEVCRGAGLFVELQNETHNSVPQANVIARPVEGRPEDEFLLQTHLDTPDAGNFGFWRKTGANPFNATIYSDTIYGLGAASAKLDYLCKLMALKELGARDWRKPPVLVGTFGEEIGMPGVIKLVRKKKINAKQALVGEATDLRLIGACKGYVGVEIEVPFSTEEKEFRTEHDRGDGRTSQSRVFIGKAAHSSVPQMGDSAIWKMLDYLTKLPEGLAVMEIEGGINPQTVPAHAVLEIDVVGAIRDPIAMRIARLVRAVEEVGRRFKTYPDAAFELPEPSLNIGMIRTYEDFVQLSGCCRFPPTVTDAVYEEWMEILRAACAEVGAVFRVSDYKKPFRTAVDEALVGVCQEQLGALKRPVEVGALSVTTEANVLSRFGISCLVIGPGRGVGNSHAPDEHVKIEELHDAIRFYKGVLERVCL